MTELIKKIHNRIDQLIGQSGNHSLQIMNLSKTLENLENILNNNVRAVRTVVLNELEALEIELHQRGDKHTSQKIAAIVIKLATKL